MPDEKIERIADRLSIADISTAIAYGLQRSVTEHNPILRDRILIYGGEVKFNVQILPPGAAPIKQSTDLSQG